MFGTRTYLEVRVGKVCSAEVILHLRKADVSWFHYDYDCDEKDMDNDNDKEWGDGALSMTKQTRLPDVLQLLQESVIPRMFADEVEAMHTSQSRSRKKVPPGPLGPGGIPLPSIETHNNSSNSNKPLRKKRRLTKKQKAELAKHEQEQLTRKKEKDLYYAFGSNLQLAYRLEEPETKPTITLCQTMSTSRSHDEASSSRYIQVKKLSKRIAVWCSPYDPTSNTVDEIEEDPLGRPEFIPMAQLFRQTKNSSSKRSRS